MSISTMKIQNISCRELRGVGERVAAKLARLSIFTLSDLLFHFPLRYEDRTQIEVIQKLTPLRSAVIEVTLQAVTAGKGRTKLMVYASDDSGRIVLRFFNTYQ